MDLSAAPSEVGIVVECLPQVVDGFTPRFSTSIKKHADIRLSGGDLRWGLISRRNSAYLKHFSNSIEEPSMGVYLLLILGFQDENDLDGHEVVRIVANW